MDRGGDHSVGPVQHSDHAAGVAARDHHARAGGEGEPVPAAPAQRADDRLVGDAAGGVDAAESVDHIRLVRRAGQRQRQRQRPGRARPARPVTASS